MENFQAISFDNHPQGAAIQRILSAAIQAVSPEEAIRRTVTIQDNVLRIGNTGYALKSFGQIFSVAIGKAAIPMSKSIGEILGESLDQGLVVSKQNFGYLDERFTLLTGGHPVPDEKSYHAGTVVMNFVDQLEENDLLICLISGGGSALVTSPYVGVSLDDIQKLTIALLKSGARIDEINTLRRHLDRIKGGNLARQAAPASVISLILSDVVNSPLEAIASGPTAPDPTFNQEAIKIIQQYHLENLIPGSILYHLQKNIETPKPLDPVFDRVQNVIIGSNELASEAALQQAREEGFHAYGLGNAWQGEAREVADQLAKILVSDHSRVNFERPACLVAGGETTVTLLGNGTGGRNQEVALAAVPLLAGHEDVMLVTLATDGEDGPTDAAGAVVTGETLARAIALGLDPEKYLANNDAYHFFEPLGDLLQPGSTGTNVNDLTFLFAF